MRPWHLGNTTVRSPFRLRDGLVALSQSPLQGHLHGREQEVALRHLLGQAGIVELGEDSSYSVGRKWRSALGKLGFLYPEVPARLELPQNAIGPLDMITPNGWRLVQSETVSGMQECFLRALAAHYIPSALERDFDYDVFSPLRHVLAIMLELERQTGESRLNFIEMALIVQISSSSTPIDEVVLQVLELRNRRIAAPNKKVFDREARNEAAALHGYVESTFKDYADTNFRYLKATGLVQTRGKGIALTPERHVFIENLVEDAGIPDSDRSYLITLCNGAVLPTDNQDTALVVLNDLLRQLNRRGIPFDMAGRATASPADIAIIRHQIEELLFQNNEELYAEQQAQQWEEIAAYMELLIHRRGRATLSNGEDIMVPQDEAPAYFEWILWRAFLAIDSLVNRPYEARRFRVDQDFLPVGCAAGGGPDMIFEFEDFALVVEVTLTTNSRQEAAEGEPVRRHVADLVTHYHEQAQKPVYGLFLANRIDSNTAETFRIGVWYTNTDDRMQLNIVPITLAQFRSVFTALFVNERVEVDLVRELLDRCSELREANEAPAWKREIEQTITQQITALGNN